MTSGKDMSAYLFQSQRGGGGSVASFVERLDRRDPPRSDTSHLISSHLEAASHTPKSCYFLEGVRGEGPVMPRQRLGFGKIWRREEDADEKQGETVFL